MIGFLPRSEDESYTNIETLKDISFSGERDNYCVSYVDLVNSTKIVSHLTDEQISTYYGIFLNSIAKIARNFAAKIIKNSGDALIFYFPDTSVLSNNISLKRVIECALTMLDARRIINRQLYLSQLPSINYRISADYGRLEMVKTSSSRAKDFFGSTMNLCAKINSKAKPNSFVIGENLFKHVRSLKGYRFSKVDSYSYDRDTKYNIYSIGISSQPAARFSKDLHARRALNKLSSDILNENVRAEPG